MFGTDVGGIYRSMVGGKRWHATGPGFDPVCGLDIAMDPRNASRVLVVGSAPVAGKYCGVYCSTDKGATWTLVLPDERIGDVFDRRGESQLVIDDSSFALSDGFCARIYYSSGSGIFYTSKDGGSRWEEQPSLKVKSMLALSSDNGWLYAANGKTIYRSKDHGASFQAAFSTDSKASALDAAGQIVVVGTESSGVYVSENHGDSFARKSGAGMPQGPKRRLTSLRVSPIDPRRIMAFVGGGDKPKLYSHDGGEHWAAIDVSNMRHTVIEGVAGVADEPFTWHPLDANVCWEARHDFMSKSTDGGKSFFWSNRGYTGIYLGQGGTFFFNVNHPEYLALPSVDWNGAATYDGGKSWQNLHGDPTVYPWWGWTYGCYAVSPRVRFFGASQAHEPWAQQLKVTRDGGKTFESYKLPVDWRPSWNAYQDPTDDNVWFYCNYRSNDAGHTWKKIAADVLTHDPRCKTLYGRAWEKSSSAGWIVVKSEDHGVTWQKVFRAGGGDLKDIAVDHVHRIVYALHPWGLDKYIADTKTLTAIKSFPKDQYGNGPNLWSVAVDPVQPNILYLANGAHYYRADNSVMRSLDSGQSWKSISIARRHGNVDYSADGGGGCVEALWCRVNPKTREPLVGTNDFGFWTFGPPVQKSTGGTVP
jgi:photosystem II stability/assembly factor-like uncharacterized protein